MLDTSYLKDAIETANRQYKFAMQNISHSPMEYEHIKSAMNAARDGLECIVDALLSLHALPVKDAEGMSIPLYKRVQTLSDEKVLTEDEYNTFTNLRKKGNKLHEKMAEITEKDAVDCAPLLKSVIEIAEKFLEGERDSSKPLDNAFNGGAIGYFSQRRCYSKWAFVFDRNKLLMIPEYSDLETKAKAGDIMACLDIAQGFLPYSIRWGSMNQVCYPIQEDRKTGRIIRDIRYIDCRYYYWIGRAVEQTYKIYRKSGIEGVKNLPAYRFIPSALIDYVTAFVTELFPLGYENYDYESPKDQQEWEEYNLAWNRNRMSENLFDGDDKIDDEYVLPITDAFNMFVELFKSEDRNINVLDPIVRDKFDYMTMYNALKLFWLYSRESTYDSEFISMPEYEEVSQKKDQISYSVINWLNSLMERNPRFTEEETAEREERAQKEQAFLEEQRRTREEEAKIRKAKIEEERKRVLAEQEESRAKIAAEQALIQRYNTEKDTAYKKYMSSIEAWHKKMLPVAIFIAFCFVPLFVYDHPFGFFAPIMAVSSMIKDIFSDGPIMFLFRLFCWTSPALMLMSAPVMITHFGLQQEKVERKASLTIFFIVSAVCAFVSIKFIAGTLRRRAGFFLSLVFWFVYPLLFIHPIASNRWVKLFKRYSMQNRFTFPSFEEWKKRNVK